MKILSIDLDFLTENLTYSENEKDFIINDPFKINIIQKLLEKQEKEKLNFIVTHGEIVNYINQPVTIYNFDHHHDIFYQEEIKNLLKIEAKKENNILEEKGEDLESCWVYWLYKKGLLKDYYCFLNPNSEINKNVLKYGFKFFINYYSQYDPYRINLYETNFDMVFIVKSPDYTDEKSVKFIMKLLGFKGDEFNDK